jgi:hypothetical protein
VKKSREFYNITIPFETDLSDTKSSILQTLVQGVEHELLAPNVISIFNGVHWRRLLPEELGTGISPCEHALTELRQLLYRLIHVKKSVTEYGATPNEPFECLQVSMMLQ